MHKKHVLFIVIILSTLNTFSQVFFNQYEKGKIEFRDGKEIEGFIKITSAKKIKFKKTKKDKKKVFGYKSVKRIKKIYGDEYIFKIEKGSGQILLLELEKSGKLDLLSKNERSMSTIGNSGFTGKSFKIYYLSKKNSDFASLITGNEKSKSYKNSISEFVFDCDKLLKLISDKKSIKEKFDDGINSITENIIEYYNNSCE